MSHKLHAAVLEVAKQNEVAVGASGQQGRYGRGLRRVSFSERLEGETLPLYCRVQIGEFPSWCANIAGFWAVLQTENKSDHLWGTPAHFCKLH